MYCYNRRALYVYILFYPWYDPILFSTWDVSRAAKRVISWSSLDWDRGRWNQLGNEGHLQEIYGIILN